MCGLPFILQGNIHSTYRTESTDEGRKAKDTVMFKYKSYGERLAMKNDETVIDANMLVPRIRLRRTRLKKSIFIWNMKRDPAC